MRRRHGAESPQKHLGEERGRETSCESRAATGRRRAKPGWASRPGSARLRRSKPGVLAAAPHLQPIVTCHRSRVALCSAVLVSHRAPALATASTAACRGTARAAQAMRRSSQPLGRCRARPRPPPFVLASDANAGGSRQTLSRTSCAVLIRPIRGGPHRSRPLAIEHELPPSCGARPQAGLFPSRRSCTPFQLEHTASAAALACAGESP